MTFMRRADRHQFAIGRNSYKCERTVERKTIDNRHIFAEDPQLVSHMNERTIVRELPQILLPVVEFPVGCGDDFSAMYI